MKHAVRVVGVVFLFLVRKGANGSCDNFDANA